MFPLSTESGLGDWWELGQSNFLTRTRTRTFPHFSAYITHHVHFRSRYWSDSLESLFDSFFSLDSVSSPLHLACHQSQIKVITTSPHFRAITSIIDPATEVDAWKFIWIIWFTLFGQFISSPLLPLSASCFLFVHKFSPKHFQWSIHVLCITSKINSFPFIHLICSVLCSVLHHTCCKLCRPRSLFGKCLCFVLNLCSGLLSSTFQSICLLS
jgi:hypothetical protein